MSRRLPVYLLLDCSESMAGPALDSVATCVSTMAADLRKDPLAIETVHLSVITFARTASQVVPLTEVMQFIPPRLSVRTGTALGGAVRLLLDCMKKDVVRSTATTKGDYKPLVFLLTDGYPTDDWESAADALKLPSSPKIANVFAVGMGSDVDVEVLYRFTDAVLFMPKSTSVSIRNLFVWMSASIVMTSARPDASAEGGIHLGAAPPADIEVAPRGTTRRGERGPEHIFLHALCGRTRRPYLMRYQRNEMGKGYDAVSAHPLDVVEDDAQSLLPPVSTSLLHGVPGCPHCANPGAAACGSCRRLFCTSPRHGGARECPGCRAVLTESSGSRNFDIKPSNG